MSSLTGKMQNETSKAEEEIPKRRKLVHELDSIQEDKKFKSNLIHEKVPFGTDMDVSIALSPHPHDQDMEDIVESYIQELILSIKDDREKHPLPNVYLNYCQDGNCMLRFEDIGIGAANPVDFTPLFIPGGLSEHMDGSGRNLYGQHISTTTLYLDMVYPIISASKLKRIFDEYGECCIDLPAEKGCGFVTFKHRQSAECALRSLQPAFATNNICNLSWGVEEDIMGLDDNYEHYLLNLSPRPCDILGRYCTYSQQ